MNSFEILHTQTSTSCFLLSPQFLLFHFWLHELIVFACIRVLYSLFFSSSGPEILISMNFSLALTYCSDSSFLSFPRDNVHTVYCPLLDPATNNNNCEHIQCTTCARNTVNVFYVSSQLILRTTLSS